MSSKPRVYLLPAKLGDEKVLGVDVRPADRREWEDGIPGTTLETSVRRCIVTPGGIATTAYAALDGQMLAMWGVNPYPDHPTFGVVWFAARQCAKNYLHGIHYHWRFEIDRMEAAFPHGLHAFPDSRQLVHHKWMERMGFERKGSIAYDPGPFVALHYVRRP